MSVNVSACLVALCLPSSATTFISGMPSLLPPPFDTSAHTQTCQPSNLAAMRSLTTGLTLAESEPSIECRMRSRTNSISRRVNVLCACAIQVHVQLSAETCGKQQQQQQQSDSCMNGSDHHLMERLLTSTYVIFRHAFSLMALSSNSVSFFSCSRTPSIFRKSSMSVLLHCRHFHRLQHQQQN